MTTFMELSVTARGLLTLWFAVLLMISCVATFRLFSQKTFILAVPSLVVMLASYILVQWCSDIAICYDKGIMPTHSPYMIKAVNWTWLLWIGLLLSVAAVCFFLHAYRWSKTHISASSLKEGMDDLPSGLCWYYEDGTIALRNRVMERLCLQVTGHSLHDGSILAEELMRRMDENNVMTLPDSAWSISISTVEDKKSILHEICAYDITKEYETTRSLEKKKKEAEDANENLTRYSREIAQMITAGEILAAKVRIHDELGQGLLLTRKYLLRGGNEEDKEKLLYVLRKNNTLLESSRKESDRTYLEMILEAAGDMGVEISIDGKMPANRSVSDVITTAIHENLTNTIRHAQGDRMWLKLTDDGEGLTAVFTNNGNPPRGPIEERGGLAMLRALVEAAGGKMVIDHEPEYKMTLRFE